jgi:hypothetical protein
VASVETGLRFDAEAQLTVIPPGDLQRGFGVALWHDAAPRLRRFILVNTRDRSRITTAPAEANCDAIIPVLVGLIPRPDNDYDDRAIAVTAPPSHGGDVLDRHLGYLYSKWLHRMSPLIHELTAHSPVPVGCHGYLELYNLDRVRRDEDEPWRLSINSPLSPAEEAELGFSAGTIRLQWAWSDELEPLVAAYVAQRRKRATTAANPDESEPDRLQVELRRAHLLRLADLLHRARAARAITGAWGQETAFSRAQDSRDAAAVEQLAAWATWRPQPHGRHGMTAVSPGSDGNAGVVIIDDHGVTIGRWLTPEGPLTLVDERARADVLAALAAHGITVDQQPDLHQLSDFPDALVRIDGSTWTIHSVNDDLQSGHLPEIGRYDRDRDVLTVYARPHQDPVSILLRRHGLTPGSVSYSAPSRDTAHHNQQARAARARATPLAEDLLLDGQLPLRGHLRRHLPAEYAAHLPTVWRPADSPRGASDPVVDDAHRHALQTLLGTADTSGFRRGRCRLCSDHAFGRGPLAYCLWCISRARRGIIRDTGVDEQWTDIAVWALRRLSQLEFTGPPSQAQLTRLTVTDPDNADAAMLCRFLIPRPATAALPARPHRPARTWPEWLHHAGLLNDGLRTARGTISIATDGHLCRSMLERHIDDFLHHQNIAHDVEPTYPHHPELNTTGLRADWRLADGTYVEALGLPDDPAYAAKVARKRQLAALTGIRLITLTADDLDRLPDVFARWLPPPTPAVRSRLR